MFVFYRSTVLAFIPSILMSEITEKQTEHRVASITSGPQGHSSIQTQRFFQLVEDTR